MNFWSPFPFIRIVFAFCTGILLTPALSQLIEVSTQQMITICSMLIFFGAWVLRLSNGLVGGIALIAIVFLGLNYTNLRTSSLPISADYEKSDGFSGKIVSYPENKGRFRRVEILSDYILRRDSLIPAKLRILLYINDSSDLQLSYSDHLFVRSQVQSIKPPSNPGEFDFSGFWSRKGIYYQAFISGDDYEILQGSEGHVLLRKSYEIRDYCKTVIEQSINNPDSEAIAMALILGVKDGLDSEIKEAYAASGAMHVLAVSGLHVGILYLFILFLFKPIRDKKYGELITGVFSLVILWFYALVTGFSPSVQRAVVMFSIFIVGRMFGRSRNIYNSLAFSAFVLLLINPMMIYDVGFQLSYLAVFGIVFLHPRLYQLWSPDNIVINKAWELSCVSISAQLATFPLGLYYFHQFPTLFLVSNLVVIPMAFLILILGISLLLTSILGIPILGIVSTLANGALWLMNELVFGLQAFDFSLIQHIQLSTFQTILLYGMILSMITLFLYRDFRSLVLGVTLSLLIVVIELGEIGTRSTKNELVFYDVKGKSLVDLRNGLDAELIASGSDLASSVRYIIQPHRMQSNLMSGDIKIRGFGSWESPVNGIQVKEWNGTTMVRLHDLAWTEFDLEQKIEIDLLIVSNNSVKSLDQIRQTFKANLVLIDSSNGYYRSNKLKEEAEVLDINVHSTHHQGALTIDL